MLNMFEIAKDDVDLFVTAFDRCVSKSDFGKCEDLTNEGYNEQPIHKFEQQIFDVDLKYCIEISQEVTESVPNCEQLMSLKKFLSVEEILDLLPLRLKSALEEISPCERLQWMVNLLIEYHSGSECSTFMAKAIKIIVIAIELSCCNKKFEIRDYGSHYHHYVGMIVKYKCSEDTVSQALKMFVLSKPELKYFFFLHTKNFKYIMGNIPKTDLELRKFLWYPQKDELFINQFESLFLYQFQTFEALVEYGAYHIINDFEKGLMKYRIDVCIDKPVPPNLSVFLYHLRTLQIISLYKENVISRKDYALKLLWAAIPEPFLSFEDMLSSVKYMTQDGTASGLNVVAEGMYKRFLPLADEELKQMWLWYKKVLFEREEYVKSPRSLKHLSRCSIRLNLSMNLFLPHNVQPLKLSEVLHDYLLLKDCDACHD